MCMYITTDPPINTIYKLYMYYSVNDAYCQMNTLCIKNKIIIAFPWKPMSVCLIV